PGSRKAEYRNPNFAAADPPLIAAELASGHLSIATCAANLGPSGRYSKSVDCLAGLESLYDIVNIHNYAEIEGWPTWKRSYAEDPGINFLKGIRHVLTWRNEHAPNKELWLT